MKWQPYPSRTEFQILALLASGELYGLEIVRCSRNKVKRGTVFTTLGRMSEKGFVESRAETAPSDDYHGIGRRRYKLTELGARALKACKILNS